MNVQRAEIERKLDLGQCEEEPRSTHLIEWTGSPADTREPSVSVSGGSAQTTGFERLEANYEFLEGGSA